MTHLKISTSKVSQCLYCSLLGFQSEPDQCSWWVRPDIGQYLHVSWFKSTWNAGFELLDIRVIGFVPPKREM